jgi:four helix bundle protein
MNSDDLKQSTKAFALRIIRLVESLPPGKVADLIGKQLVKCGTSVGANYRASCHAKSQADFIAKMGIVEEEADESIYWMEALVESGLMRKERIEDLMDEADQLVSIFVSSINTARGNKRNNNKIDGNR